MANPSKFHGIGPFDPLSGETVSQKVKTFSDSFGETMLELAETNPKLCTITAAMPTGTGLTSFQKAYPERTFDVGIAEEHAVSMAGGLAKQGMVPVVALYSTFLQRSFDQIMQDIAMLKLHVVLAIDRAGLVGDDGETHHGIYDIGFLRQVPGMRILCPVSIAEQADMLRWAVSEYDGPVAVRYPRGGNGSYVCSDWNGSTEIKCHRQGTDVTLITYGTMLDNALEAAELLSKVGTEAKILRLLEISALDILKISNELIPNKPVIVVEETANRSGICQELSHELQKKCVTQVCGLDLGHRFVTHGTKVELYNHYNLDAQSIADYTQEVLRLEN